MKRGFTLIETLVAAVCVVLVFQGVFAFLKTSQRGTRHGIEVSEQIKDTTLLVRALEGDMAGLLPWTATSTEGQIGRAPEITTNGKESECLFSLLYRGKSCSIRYRYDSSRMEVTRSLETNGNADQTIRFGTGVFEEFSLKPIGQAKDLFLLRMKLKGMLANNTFERVLVGGFAPNATESRHWVFSCDKK
ncbi:MAG: hypothetical protein HQM09_08655 [Candidatus Riflebacteria bacterium]|nr:hypothetical protein [Candidatus Riflebacteria bacterium]